MSFSSSDEFESWCESFVDTYDDPLITQPLSSTSTEQHRLHESNNTSSNTMSSNNSPRYTNSQRPELGSTISVVTLSSDRSNRNRTSRSSEANNTTQSSSPRRSKNSQNGSTIPIDSVNTSGAAISTNHQTSKRRAGESQQRSNNSSNGSFRIYQGVSDSEEDEEDDEEARSQLQSILNDKSLGKPENEEAFKGMGGIECPICFDSPKYACALPCGHLYCNNCVNKVVAYHHKCSICRKAVKLKDIKFLQFKIKV